MSADMVATAPSLDMFNLAGRTAIVTGASSGLGVRFARVLHAAGARVVLSARRVDRLDALAAELSGAHVIAADVSDAHERERLVEQTLERFGALHVLVNNAGVGQKVALEDESLESFRMTMEVNVTAVWHLCKLAAPHIEAAGGGAIVNIASMLGHVGATPVKQAGYCASKGAVLNLTRELALQLARRGIRVNAISPGWFPSEMTAAMDGDEASQTFVRRHAAIARMGRDEELDGALLLLASEAGSYITGQSIVVDGGWTAR
jgi:NAD(P)-dependent dehydrogenase (short-subunit alcohol dehydrogenase family)